MPLVEIKNLQVSFQTKKGAARVVDDVSLEIEEGKTLGLVGESGSGKSVLSMSILRLLEENGRVDGGEILFTEGARTLDLVKIATEEMYKIRGNHIAMIFQEPMTALNPVFTIEKQLSEPLRIHRGFSRTDAAKQSQLLLKKVGIERAEKVAKQYPHQLSGGMRQRVMIAMALACQPKLLIADEPTTALDVTIQAQILRLMRDLQAENGAAILFITHDLGVIREMADEVAVLYCGQIVERAKTPLLFSGNGYRHPYTEGLIASLPDVHKKRLEAIFGNVPSPFDLPVGCRFSPRCKYCTERCMCEEPKLKEVEKGHWVRCFYPSEEKRRSEAHERLIIHRTTE